MDIKQATDCIRQDSLNALAYSARCIAHDLNNERNSISVNVDLTDEQIKRVASFISVELEAHAIELINKELSYARRLGNEY